MRRHRRRTALLSLLLALSSGCASDGIEVSTSFDPLSAFPEQATYAWDEASNRLPADPRLQELDLGPLIREAANHEFSSRGYREATSGTPGYRLSYELTVHSWIGPDNSTSVGSLSLLLVSAPENRRVWMGYGRAEVQAGLSRDERRERLRGAMARMLENFPPAQRKN